MLTLIYIEICKTGVYSKGCTRFSNPYLSFRKTLTILRHTRETQAVLPNRGLEFNSICQNQSGVEYEQIMFENSCANLYRFLELLEYYAWIEH